MSYTKPSSYLTSVFSFKIELMENEDILYGYYTGKKTDCKTRAWSPFPMNSFWKCMIGLKTFEAKNIFEDLLTSIILLLFCWPNKSLWNFRIPKLNIFMEFPDTKIKYFFWIMIQMIDSVVGIKKEINKIRKFSGAC